MQLRSLVVDDARVTQLILERILNAYGTCNVARNGTEAMQVFSEAFEAGRGHDLVCLDMGLPDFGGLELLTKIRAYEEQHGRPEMDRARVIAITASSDAATIRAFTQMGDGYILKPINRDRLIRDIVNLGLIAPSAADSQLVTDLERLCQSDALPMKMLAHLMREIAGSIGRQSNGFKPGQ